MPSPLFVLVGLVACTGSLRPLAGVGSEGGATIGSGDTGSPPAPPSVDEVQPGYGTTGAAVVVSGGPFGEDTSFTLAGVPVFVASRSEGSVELEVPDLEVDGWVELRATPSRRGAPGASFRYFTSAAEGLGTLGLLGRYHHQGGYWPDGVEDFAAATVVFPVGPAPSWPEWRFAPTIDSCARQLSPSSLEAYAPGVSELTLEANDDARTELTLPEGELPEGTPAFTLQTSLEALVAGASLNLAPMEGSEDWPALEVADLVEALPTDFVVTSPPLASTTTPLVAEGFDLAWEGPYDGEILVVLERNRWLRDQARFALQETVTCWLVDDGAHDLPDLWTDWAPIPTTGDYDVVDIVIGRVHSATAILPHNQGRSGVLGGTFSIGQVVASQ